MNWKKLLNLEHEPTFGLDIGSSSVKLLQLQKDQQGSYSVSVAALADIAGDGFDKALVEVNTVSAIRNCLQSVGIENRLAVCGVSGPEVAVRDFKFPALSPEEVANAAALEAGQACPFQIAESTVDYHILSSSPESLSGILVAATNKIVKNKVRLAGSAEVKSVLMEVDGLALLNCFTEIEGIRQGQTVTILNVGSACSNLAILSDGYMPFVRDVLHAGSDIMAEIAKEKNIPKEKIKEILCSEGLSSPQIGAEVVQKACQKLVGDITDTIRYYTAQQKSAFIDKIYVCGGFAMVKGFVEFLGTQLSAKTVLWDPCKKIAVQNPQFKSILEKNGPAMTVVAGLAMRSI